MHPHPNIVQTAIDRHRHMVALDESCFDENGIAFDEKVADKSEEAETKAFVHFCAVKCTDDNDVQAKLDYLLNGSVGVRTTLVDCLSYEEYGGPDAIEQFLRSLVLPEGAR